jgi:hypothetical protein
VISQSPDANTSVAAGSAVDLVVSTGAASASASAAPTSLAFGNQALNSTSNALAVTITNTGGVVLPTSSVTLAGSNPGQFAYTNNCPAQVAVGGNCWVDVVFKPSSEGAKSAQLAISLGDGAGGVTVTLTGTGVRSAFSVSPASLSFGNVARGTTSTAQTVMITNSGTVVLPITSISITGKNGGQFAHINNCPTQVAVGGTCTVDVVFKPIYKGSKSAELKIRPGGGASAKTVALSGTGI